MPQAVPLSRYDSFPPIRSRAFPERRSLVAGCQLRRGNEKRNVHSFGNGLYQDPLQLRGSGAFAHQKHRPARNILPARKVLTSAITVCYGGSSPRARAFQTTLPTKFASSPTASTVCREKFSVMPLLRSFSSATSTASMPREQQN